MTATSPATSPSHHDSHFPSASVRGPAMTNEKKGETRSYADDGDDERCRCSECLLKFHREMARWFRERVSLQRAKGGVQRCQAGQRSKSKKRTAKKDKRDGRHPVKQGKRRWMPWSTVIQEISASTLLEPEDVKLVLDEVKRLGTEEVMNGHTFVFPGLAMFKLQQKPRVVARACEGRAWKEMNVYGNPDSWK